MSPRTVLIKIEGAPLPWKTHGGYGKRSFDPRAKEKSKIKSQVMDQYKASPYPGPVVVSYEFELPIPKGTSKVKRKKMIDCEIDHIKRPDLSNLVKLLEDCLKGIVFTDDSQVRAFKVSKVYSENPCSTVLIQFM